MTTTRARKPTTATDTAKRTRGTKTPAQRAQEALDVAERRVTKLDAALQKLIQEQRAVAAELEDAARRRDYAALNPDLPQTTDTPPAVVPGQVTDMKESAA